MASSAGGGAATRRLLHTTSAGMPSVLPASRALHTSSSQQPLPVGASQTGNGSSGGLIIRKSGRLSSCRASFIHPNLETSTSSGVPRRQDSFDSLNYSSSSSDYENDWTIAELLECDQDVERRRKLRESTAKEEIHSIDCDSSDREMENIRSLVCDDELDMDEKDDTIPVSTQQELDWFKLAGLDSLVAKLLEDDSGKCDDVQLQTLTKSQSDTVKRRLASLRNTISNKSSQLTLEGLSRCPTLTEAEFSGTLPDGTKSYPGKVKATRKPPWRDVRDVFVPTERRSSSSSESHDGEHDPDASNISSRSDFLSSMDSVDSDRRPSQTPSTHSSPENHRAVPPYRQAYCLTQSAETPSKPRNPPHRWLAPLGSQAAADVVGQDLETGVRILKINYPNGYDTVVEQEPPLPAPVWPQATAAAAPGSPRLGGAVDDIQLEFAYRSHPAGSPDPQWPNVVMKAAPTGVCQIDDLLWEGDETSVKQLALIELTKIYDDRQLAVQKRRIKPKRKIKNSPEIGIFGSSLDRLIVLDNNRRGSDNMLVGNARLASHVPIVFQQMLDYLEECGGIQEEGILRICGETNRMRRLRADLDAFYSNPVIIDDNTLQPADETQWFRRIFQTVSVHDIASVMKQFLRDLPQPLLTNDLVDAFSQISDIPDRLTQIQALNLLVLQLPLAERATLKTLLRSLRKMVEAEKFNKMSSANIAMIITPNLFHPKGVDPPSPPLHHSFFPPNKSVSSAATGQEKREPLDPAKQFSLIAKLSEVTRIMIVYSHLLFTVPPSFLRQIRTTHALTLSSLHSSAKSPKERRIRRLDPRRIRRAPKNLPVLPESDRTESTFFQQQFPQDQVVVIRVRLRRRYSTDEDHHHKVSTAVQVSPGLTAGDVVAKFMASTGDSLTSSPEVSGSADKLNLSTSSGVSGSDKSSSSSNEDLLNIDGQVRGAGMRRTSDCPRREIEPPVTLQTHFLVEHGGNIGLRRLDHHVSIAAAYQLNPNATWIVRFFP